MEMVRRGFLPLLTARYDEFLDGAVIGGNVVQPLRLIQPDNTVEVALYTMERQRDGQWRIVGCAVVPSTVKAA
jgi:nucleoside-diphosphate-sugar epimerase